MPHYSILRPTRARRDEKRAQRTDWDGVGGGLRTLASEEWQCRSCGLAKSESSCLFSSPSVHSPSTTPVLPLHWSRSWIITSIVACVFSSHRFLSLASLPLGLIGPGIHGHMIISIFTLAVLLYSTFSPPRHLVMRVCPPSDIRMLFHCVVVAGELPMACSRNPNPSLFNNNEIRSGPSYIAMSTILTRT
ncbi:hypothetical protein OG21DRAFT_1143216 [Imleria badia]|nr:hypothetical protein OG21DRAFT_1143216 [Imleria badia]